MAVEVAVVALHLLEEMELFHPLQQVTVAMVQLLQFLVHL
jgi:hypothetical protein